MAHVFDAIAAHYGPLRLPKGYLKRYQRRGIPTLVSKLCSMGTALLADEMGLGKTIQGVLTALGFAALGGGGPVLLIVPTSAMAAWKRQLEEVRKFPIEPGT